jgi:hypothetical protein
MMLSPAIDFLQRRSLGRNQRNHCGRRGLPQRRDQARLSARSVQIVEHQRQHRREIIILGGDF